MHITLYRSIICPRCHMAGRSLRQIAEKDSTITVDEIDIMKHPRSTIRDGVRFIPAIRIGDKILSGLYLTRDRIESFIAEHKH